MRDRIEPVVQPARRVHALQRFGQWLYFTGSVSGPGTYRVLWDSLGLSDGGEALSPWSGSTIDDIYHTDETHIYWLDNEVVYRQGLDDVIESIPLGERYYNLGGDADTVVVTGIGCSPVVLIDKRELTLRAVEPPTRVVGGGYIAVTADGRNAYCAAGRYRDDANPATAADIIDTLYTIDKSSAEITYVDVAVYPDKFEPPRLLVDDGTLYGIYGGRFWEIEPATGVHTELASTSFMSLISVSKDPGTDWFYFLTSHDVQRYRRGADSFEVLLEPIAGSTWRGFAQDEEYVWWVQKGMDARAEDRHENGDVYSIAHGPIEDAIVRLRKPEK
jgi:hypothetical protein